MAPIQIAEFFNLSVFGGSIFHDRLQPASKMPQVAKSIRKERAARLRDLGNIKKQEAFANLIGKTISVLVEKDNFGHSANYAPTYLRGKFKEKTIVKAIVQEYDEKSLIAQGIK